MSKINTSSLSLAVIIPASNESEYIGRCLKSLLEQESAPKLLVIVYCNGCRDDTQSIVNDFKGLFASLGHRLECRETTKSGKILALNAAEQILETEFSGTLPRAYLDADILCSSELVSQAFEALSQPDPTYVTGTMQVMKANSSFTSAYSQFWQQLPFYAGGATGAGFFAVNPAGRARWGKFPDIISDDTFVRLHFTPQERVEVTATYQWPMAEGFRDLVKVRRRQDAGVRQVAQLFPELAENDKKRPLSVSDLAVLFLSRPIGFLAYLVVYAFSRRAPTNLEWTRVR